jgi:hypothetical protein
VRNILGDFPDKSREAKGVPQLFFWPKSNLFWELKPNAKYRNPRTSLLGLKYSKQKEREKEKKKKCY